jgi:hypothetical protein
MVATIKNKNQTLGRDIMRLQPNFRLTARAGFALLAAAIGLCSGLPSGARAAEEWPTREVTFYVPYAPGGSTDPDQP